MHIKRCLAIKVPFYMGSKLWNPMMRFATKDTVYVFVETESGECGVGEVWPAYGSADSIVFIINNDIAPLVAGEESGDIDRIRDKVYKLSPLGGVANLLMNAIGGLDIALWDLKGKLSNKPISQLLGSKSDAIYTYASGGLYGKDKGLSELAAEMGSYIKQGFDAVKIKIGGLPIPEDVDRVATVRQAIGPQARLMVDAVHAYSVKEAMEVAEKIRPYDIYWFESPVALDDMGGHGIVNTQSGIPVCANESLSNIYQYEHLLSHNGATFVHFDLSTCGGISEAVKIAKLAESEGLDCTLHAATGVHLYSASLQVAASILNLDSVERHFTHHWLSEGQPEILEHDGPYAKPTGKPGVGTPFITPGFIEATAKSELAKASQA
jgi:L-alanine-DL-glutamate epimerase-like enolase superfamily enzyme